jgi:hypothetical protein
MAEKHSGSSESKKNPFEGLRFSIDQVKGYAELSDDQKYIVGLMVSAQRDVKGVDLLAGLNVSKAKGIVASLISIAKRLSPEQIAGVKSGVLKIEDVAPTTEKIRLPAQTRVQKTLDAQYQAYTGVVTPSPDGGLGIEQNVYSVYPDYSSSEGMTFGDVRSELPKVVEVRVPVIPSGVENVVARTVDGVENVQVVDNNTNGREDISYVHDVQIPNLAPATPGTSRNRTRRTLFSSLRSKLLAAVGLVAAGTAVGLGVSAINGGKNSAGDASSSPTSVAAPDEGLSLPSAEKKTSIGGGFLAYRDGNHFVLQSTHRNTLRSITFITSDGLESTVRQGFYPVEQEGDTGPMYYFDDISASKVRVEYTDASSNKHEITDAVPLVR